MSLGTKKTSLILIHSKFSNPLIIQNKSLIPNHQILIHLGLDLYVTTLAEIQPLYVAIELNQNQPLVALVS